MVLSIVVITMNDDHGLEHSLESVAHQLDCAPAVGAAIDLLVVDGAARSRTAEITKSIMGDRCAWQVLQGPDEGIYDAQNRGLARGNGSYTQFLNGGDSYARVDGGLEKVVSILRADRPFWLVVGAEYDGDRNSDRRIANIPHVWWRHALGMQAHCHQACFFRTDYLRAIGGHRLDVGLAADYDLIMKCGIVEHPLEVHEALIRYQGSGVSAKNPRRIHHETMAIRVERLDARGVAGRLLRAAFIPRTRLNGVKSAFRRRFPRSEAYPGSGSSWPQGADSRDPMCVKMSRHAAVGNGLPLKTPYVFRDAHPRAKDMTDEA